ncbi:peptidase [Citrobacter werkmanii]|nr:peptidase [Citrobacter werkmanii]EGT0672394.1 peptidase [Citrobacter werkmanii]
MNNTELIFSHNNGSLAVIMGDVVKKLLSYRQLSSSSYESAGVLIGERRGAHLIIFSISEPGPGDIRHRCSVDRRGKHHQKTVNDEFRISNGERQYLGEWHTHPEDFPNPSYRDLRSWDKNLDAAFPMVLLIVGRKSIWAGWKEGNKLIRLAQEKI